MPDRIDALIAQSTQRIEPTLSELKLQNLATNKQKKLETLLNNKFTGMYDADSPFYQNSGLPTARIGGIDGAYGNAPELKVNGQLNQEGMNARIRSDNFLMGVGSNTGDADLDPQYYQQYQDAMNKSLQEEMMLGNIQMSGQPGHTGKYGRQIVDLQRDGQSLNEDLQNRYGTRYANVDAQGNVPDTDGRFGEFIDLAQSSLIQQYGKTNKALRKISRSMADMFGVEQETIDKYLPKNSEAIFFDKSSEKLAKAEIADVEAGVKAGTRAAFQNHQKKSIKAIEEGKYGEAALDIVTNLDRHLASSVGEMVSLATYPTTALAIAARLSEQAEEYEKNNGKAPDTEWFITNGAVQSALLLGDRFLIKSGVTGALEKGALSTRAGRVGTSVAGETVQETGDTVSEEYFTQKEGDRTISEILVDPETQYAAMTGGLVAGGLKGTAETATAIPDVVKNVGLPTKVDKKIQEIKSSLGKNEAEQQATIDDRLRNVLLTIQDGSYLNNIQGSLNELNAIADIETNEAKLEGIQKVKEDFFNDIAVKDLQKDQVTLGSEQYAKDLIEDIILYSEPPVDPTIRDENIRKIAEANGVSYETAQTIVEQATAIRSKKTLEEVRKDAEYGVQGYKTYGKRLRAAEETGDTNTADIYRIKLEAFKENRLDSIDKIQRTVVDLQEKVEAGIPVKNEVEVLDDNGKLITTIWVKGSGPSREVITSGMDKVIAEMRNHIKGIDAELTYTPTKKATPKAEEAKETEYQPVETVQEPIVGDIESIEDFRVNMTEEEVQPYVKNIVGKQQSGNIEYTPKEQQFITNYSKEIENYYKSLEPTSTSQEQDTVVTKEGSTNYKEVKEGEIQVEPDFEYEGKIQNVKGSEEVKRKGTSKLQETMISSLKSLTSAVNSAAETINKVLDPKSNVTNPEKVQEILEESPARKLIYNEDGSINEATALALEVAGIEYIAFNGKMLGYKTKKDIARVDGGLEHEVSRAKQEFYNEYGMNTGVVAEQIGNSVLATLGFVRNKNIDERAYKKLVADLGNTAIHMAVSQGRMEYIEVPRSEYAEVFGGDKSGASIPFVRYPKHYRDGDYEHRKEFNDSFINGYKFLKEELELDSSVRREPSSEKIANVNDVEIRNSPMSKASKKEVKAINEVQSIEWIKNKALVDYVRNNVDLVKKRMGWVDTKNYVGTYASKDSQIAKNMQIDKSIEELLNLEPDSMYFEWFIGKNKRFYMDSNTVNPQADTFHRFAVTPKSHTGTISKDKDFRSFMYAVAQASGVSVDKSKTSKIFSEAEKILATPWKELEDKISNESYEIEHIGHYIQMVQAVKVYQEAGNKIGEKLIPFETTMSLEADGLTNGFAFKLMQFPILKNLNNWLNKVGVFTERSINGSMNDEIAEADFFDVYQDLAKDIKRGKVVPTVDKGSIWKDLSALLPEAVKGEEIKGEIRNLFKDPVMTFNYAAGMRGIKESMSYVVSEKILDGIVSGDKKYTKLAKRLNAMVEGDLVEKLVHKPLDKVKLKNQYKSKGVYDLGTLIRGMISETYGAQVEEILTKNFSEFIELNDHTNIAFKYMFKAFNEEYRAALEAVEGPLTKEVQMVELDKLLEKFPIIKGPLSDKLKEGLAIFDRSKEVLDSRWNAKTKLQSGTSSVSTIMKVFKESQKGGSVTPIHSLDASIIAELMGMGYDANFIHDAIMPSIFVFDDMVKDYNQIFYEANKKYSVTKEILDAFKRVTNNELVLQEGKERYTYDEILNSLESDYAKVSKAREELYTKSMEVSQMVGLEDGVYKVGEITEVKKDMQDISVGFSKIIDDITSKTKVVKKVQFAYQSIFGDLDNPNVRTIGGYDDAVDTIYLPDYEGLIDEFNDLESFGYGHHIRVAMGWSQEDLEEAIKVEKSNISEDHTLLHEKIHAGAKHLLRKNEDKYSKKLHRIYDKVLKLSKEKPEMFSTVNDYWKTNIDEFVAESLSNPNLINVLRSIKLDGIKTKEVNVSIFSKLLKTILDGIGKHKLDNAYEYIMDSYLAMVESSIEVKEETQYNDEQKRQLKKLFALPRVAKLLKDNNIDLKDC